MSNEILRNPITGECARVLESTSEIFRMEITFPPNCGMASEHYHPGQEQITYVQSGELHYTINGVERVLQAGDRITIKPGVSHAIWNPTDMEVRIIEEIRPAGRLHDFFKVFFSMLDEEKGTKSERRDLLLTAALFWEYRDSVFPSPFFFRMILLLLIPVVKMFGYQSEIQDRSKQTRRMVA